MKKSTRNILIGSGIVAAGAAAIGVAYHYTSKYLMKLAFDREGPKSAAKDKEKLMSSGDLSETVAAIMDAAKALEETEHEQVEITAQDGTTLVVIGSVPKMQNESSSLCTAGVPPGRRTSALSHRFGLIITVQSSSPSSAVRATAAVNIWASDCWNGTTAWIGSIG